MDIVCIHKGGGRFELDVPTLLEEAKLRVTVLRDTIKFHKEVDPREFHYEADAARFLERIAASLRP